MRVSVAVASMVVAAGVVLGSAKDAEAGIAIGADLYMAFPVDLAGSSIGAGVDGRLGYQLDLGGLWIEPGIKGGYGGFTGLGIARIMGGGRVGFGGFLVPSAFGYVGYGAQTQNVTGGGFTWTVGAALDVNIAFVSVGLYGAYSMGTFGNAGEIKWVELGPHVTLNF